MDLFPVWLSLRVSGLATALTLLAGGLSLMEMLTPWIVLESNPRSGSG